ncbi:hypothetical protein SO802_020247 [Lithocarpus litseifolius]|uniref:Uncharacterized protein n=1 Tax=Lithocarpus litseifolius TaxID=425828 RepID=A0AAW2CCK9_9ROSI
MIKFVDDSDEVPDQFVKDSSGRSTTEVNPDFVNWKNREQALFTFINSTLSPSILAITEARDKLISVGVFTDEEEMIYLALEALPPDYDAFCSAMRTCNDIFTLEELNTLLNAEERAIKKKSDFRDNSAMAMVLQGGFNLNNNRGRGRGGHQRGRGRNSGFNSRFHNGSSSFGSNTNQFSGSGSQPQFKPNNQDQIQSQQNQFHQTNRPQCQICGCSDHVTLDLSQLSLHQQPTTGTETVTVGNGQEFSVTYVGNDASSSNFPSPSPSLEFWLASLPSSSPSFSSPSYSSCTIPVSASITSLDSDTNHPLPELPSSLPLSHLSLLLGP